MTRAVDWVDRLAGVDSLALDTLDERPSGHIWAPIGPWLEWPWWRRLLDFLRSEIEWRVRGTFDLIWLLPHWRKWYSDDEKFYYPGPAECYDIAQGTYGIQIMWRLEGADGQEEEGEEGTAN